MSNYNLNPELDERLRVSLANPGSFMEDLSLVYAFHQFPVLAPKSVFFVPIEDHKALPVFTTEEELEAFLIVKTILRQKVPATRVTYRDAQSYFAIFLDDNNRKAICRLYLNGGKKYLGTLDDNKKETKFEIATLDEIFNYSEILLKTTELYEK